MPIIDREESWMTPLVDRESMFSEQWDFEVIEPADERIRDLMVRKAIAESCDLKRLVDPTFHEPIGTRPLRFRMNNSGPEWVMPYKNVIAPESIGSVINEDYYSQDLFQISHRLKKGSNPPTFRTTRTDYEENGKFGSTLVISMRGLDVNSYDFEVVRVSDLHKLEPPNPIAA